MPWLSRKRERGHYRATPSAWPCGYGYVREARVASVLILVCVLAAGCSCGNEAAEMGETGVTPLDAGGGESGASGPAEPCLHVHFTEVDHQWGLDAAAQDLVAADLDGDGLPDLVVARDREPLVVLRNRGRSGSKAFDAPVPIENSNSMGVAITDWNADGLPDLVSRGNRVMLFENRGDLQFRRIDTGLRLEHAEEHVRVADMNGDGREDIIVYGGRGMTIYPAPDPTGVLGEPFSLELGALGLRRGDVADLDGDGIPDLVVAAWGNDPFVVVAHGDGNGGFERIEQYESPIAMRSLDAAIVDIDGDGFMDVVVMGSTMIEVGSQDFENQHPLLVRLRRREGSDLEVADVLQLPSGSVGWTVAHGDLDGDGLPALVALGGGIALSDVSVEGAFHLVSQGADGLHIVAPSFIDAGTTWGRILLHDLDGDGHLDLVRATGGLSVRWGCRRD
jgi:hypothetical protein